MCLPIVSLWEAAFLQYNPRKRLLVGLNELGVICSGLPVSHKYFWEYCHFTVVVKPLSSFNASIYFPGGGVMGAVGRNAARVALEDFKNLWTSRTIYCIGSKGEKSGILQSKTLKWTLLSGIWRPVLLASSHIFSSQITQYTTAIHLSWSSMVTKQVIATAVSCRIQSMLWTQ